MTQDDIDDGRSIVVIGLAPIKPAEFVISRIAQRQELRTNRVAKDENACVKALSIFT